MVHIKSRVEHGRKFVVKRSCVLAVYSSAVYVQVYRYRCACVCVCVCVCVRVCVCMQVYLCKRVYLLACMFVGVSIALCVGDDIFIVGDVCK